MKKTLKTAVIFTIIASPAMAVSNLENPLYAPKTGEFYSKIGAGVMYKVADDSNAMRAKGKDGQTEFPIWRAAADIGYGITDNLSVNGSFGYTNDIDIDRKGLNTGRIGLQYRILDGNNAPIIWDVYADAHLGGVSGMEATLIPVAGPSLGFNYANYATGRWGAFVGTKVGKTWEKFTASIFMEALRTYGNDNNEIMLSSGAKKLIGAMAGPAGPMYAAGLPESFSVNTDDTMEYNLGIKGFYEFDDAWSLGAGFTYKRHADNNITGVNLKVKTVAPLTDAQVAAITKAVSTKFLGNLEDGWNDYILSIAIANQMTDTVQIALYGEYTYDTAHSNSQNGTDVKFEMGIRANLQF